MAIRPQRLMLKSEIPDFVDDVIKTGCDICAVGHGSYVLGDADVDDDIVDEVVEAIQRIDVKYGDRDFLILEIVAYLRSLGRYLDDPDVAHWSENPKPS